MATNTIAGVNLAQIAQQSLDALVTELLPLRAISTDFSQDIKSEGESVTTRFPTQPSAKNMNAARSSDNSTLTAKTITLNKMYGFDIGFSDIEVAKSSLKLQDLFIKPGMVAIVEQVMADIFALVTSGNYTQSTVITAANFDADKVADTAQLLSTAKVPRSPRSILIPPTFLATLVKDNAIQQSYAYGDSVAVRENRVGRVHGFDIYDYNGTIPTNSENLAGFATGPQGIIMAARQPATPTDWYGQVVNVVEPMSGLPIQFRYFYDGTEQRLQAIVLYGVQVGNPGNLYRIKTA